MPVTYVIEPARMRIHTTCSGPVSLADVIDHFRPLREDPACTGHLDVLLDVSDVDSLPESNQLRAVSAELFTIRGQVQFGLCAIIAERDAMFGMMRMFGVMAERGFRAVRVFRGAAEAEEWLVSEQKAGDHPR